MHSVSTLSIVPCRKEPTSKSELVTQLLFGELVETLETKEDWSRVRHHNDGYEGWISTAQLTPLSHSQFLDISGMETPLCSGLTGLVSARQSGFEYPIVMGSSLPGLVSSSFLLGEKVFSYKGESSLFQTRNPKLLTDLANKYLGSPYLWGGRTPFGIDCSGFTQAVYKFCGMQLPRDAWQQAEKGTALSFLEESSPGDLAFFDNKDGKIIHVGILLSPTQIIHAGNHVRIDKIDHQGIYNEEMKGYSHHLRVIKRLF